MNPVEDADSTALVPVGTLVLWVGCLAVGIVGLRTHYPHPHPPPKVTEPVRAQLMKVVLSDEPLPPPEVGMAQPPPDAAAALPQPSAAPSPVAMPAAPPLTAVATPSPEIAFALPTSGPTRVVEASQAVPMPPAATAPAEPTDTTRASAPAAVQRLTYGKEEGRQPAPEYPREAVVGREQGTVVVHFTVDENGRVVKAEAAKPCAWPLLNQAAVRAVRETWRFGAGPTRSYEVSIQFQLTER